MDEGRPATDRLGFKGDRTLHAVDDICPTVLGQHGEAKGLAHAPERWQDRLEPLGPAGDHLEPGHVWHLNEVAGGEGVDEHLEVEVGLYRRLDATRKRT